MTDWRGNNEKLEAEVARAWNEHEKTRSDWWKQRMAAVREAEQRVEQEWIERRAAAGDRLAAARLALAQARVAWAQSGERTPYPLGTRVRKWRHHWGTETYTETKEVGLLEVVTDTTRHPGNRTDKAQPGDLVVRLYKAGGGLGLRYERVLPANESRLAKMWRPVDDRGQSK